MGAILTTSRHQVQEKSPYSRRSYIRSDRKVTVRGMIMVADRDLMATLSG